jgi:hypothetical protein
MIINDLFNNKKPTVAESMTGKVVFSGTGANGGKYEIIQSGPTDFMIHANGKHIDTYGSLQRCGGRLATDSTQGCSRICQA